MGRHSEFKPEYCQMLKDHMRQGKSFETFSVTIGSCRRVLYKWCNEFPDFMQAKEEGTELAYAFFETLGIAGIAGKVENFNTGVFCFMMRNRFGWSDRPTFVQNNLNVHQHDQVKELVAELREVFDKPNEGHQLQGLLGNDSESSTEASVQGEPVPHRS